MTEWLPALYFGLAAIFCLIVLEELTKIARHLEKISRSSDAASDTLKDILQTLQRIEDQ